MTGKRKASIVIGLAVAFALALSSVASANVYCVDTTPELSDNLAIDPSCKVAVSTIQGALTAAKENPGEDSVLIGPGQYVLPAAAGPYYREVSYVDTQPGNVLHLRGGGTGATHLVMGSTVGQQTGLHIEPAEGSTVSGFELTIPANSDNNAERALALLRKVTASDLLIDGPSASNAVAVEMYGGASLQHATIDLPQAEFGSTVGAMMSGTTASISDSTVRATAGIISSGNALTVERTIFHVKTGISSDSGEVFLRDSLIDLGSWKYATGVNIANFNVGSYSNEAEIEGSTIVGGGSQSVGIRVQADDGTETATASVANTIVRGSTNPLQVLADNGRTATVSAAYSDFGPASVEVNSNLDATGAVGTANYTPTQITSVDPGFVDPASGNFRLAPASLLLDAGDPAAPPASELDLDGHGRALAATCSGAARRDLGAYELSPSCGSSAAGSGAPVLPNTAIHMQRRIATPGKRGKLKVKLTSSQPGAQFRCKLDRGKYRSCAASFTLSLARGKHTLRAKAVTVAGADPTPASASVRVVGKATASEGGNNR